MSIDTIFNYGDEEARFWVDKVGYDYCFTIDSDEDDGDGQYVEFTLSWHDAARLIAALLVDAYYNGYDATVSAQSE